MVGFLLFYSFLRPISARAAEEFETSYDVTYTVGEDGTTTVHQKISLTNLTKEFYASEHKLDVGEAEVKNIWAKDSSGVLSPQVSEDNGRRLIRVVFGAPVVGKGKTLVWELGYQTDAARHLGRVWRIDLPGIKKEPEVSSYKLTLKVPESFGEAAFISPEPIRSGVALGKRWFEFEKVQLERGGVRAGFGDYQAFDLNLKYRLENPLDQKAYLEITLPPDILGRQRIIFEKLSPAPEELRFDEDGNYLAKFFLDPREKRTIEFLGKVFVYPVRNPSDSSRTGSKAGDIPGDLREKYTRPQEFWEVDDEEIRAKAEALTDPGRPVIENVRSIYEYVVAHLSYAADHTGPGTKRYGAGPGTRRYSAGEDFERLGALRALRERDKALCTEYTDLFIALSRAAGIPARLLEGYAFTGGSESLPAAGNALHAWVEVFIPGEGWHQVDPTWGSTTGGSDYLSQFDLSHIVFVRKGLSSREPHLLVASGGGETEESWMKVSFSEASDDARARLETELEVSGTGLAGWSRKGVLVIRNPGPATAFDVRVKFVPEEVGFEGERELNLGAVPPWSEKRVPFSVSAGFFKEVVGKLEAGVGWADFSGERTGRVAPAELKFLPFWKYLFSWWGLLFLGAGLLGFGFYFRRRQNLIKPLRFKF